MPTSKTIRLGFLVCLAACSGDDRVTLEPLNPEDRTVAQFEEQGSHGCLANHQLYCDGRSGFEERITESGAFAGPSTSPSDVPWGYRVDLFSSEILDKCNFEFTDDPDEYVRRVVVVLFCTPR